MPRKKKPGKPVKYKQSAAVRKRRRENARRNYCPRKRRSLDLMRRYGITVEQYDQMLKDQDYKCPMCDTPHTVRRKLRVDHCHSSLTVRGLLCNECNVGLGLLRHDVRILERGQSYLRRLHA